ncbi:MAG: PAS domain-containing protein [Lysobacterales bacterium]
MGEGIVKTAINDTPGTLSNAERSELQDLRELYNDTPQGGLFVDRVGCLLRVNPAARRLLQLPHVSPGALLLDLLPIQVRKGWSDFLRSLLESGVAQAVELVFHDIDEPRIVRLEGALTRDGKSIRVLARSVLTASEQMLQRDRLFELSQDLLCIADTSGYFRQVNPAWTHWLGWTEAELLSRPFIELVHPDDRQTTQLVRDDLPVRPVAQFRNRYRHKNGHYEWLSWNAEGVSRGGLIFAVARIVTAEHNAEAELFRANAMRVAAEQLAGVAAWEYDPRKGVLLGMAQVRQLVGLRPGTDSMPTANALSPLPVDVLLSLHQRARRTLRRGEDFDVELKLPTPRGDRQVRIVAGRHRSEGGHWRLVGAVHDLTELRAAESALRHSEARWNAALESAGDGVWDWNVVTDEISFSDPWAAMLHYDPQTLNRSAAYWGGRIHPEDIGRVNEAFLTHAADAQRPYRVDYRILDGRGHWRWVLARGRIIERAPDGTPLRMIGTQSDIQAQKDAYRALRAWQERLR